MHNASVALMGNVQSSDRDVSQFASDPASFPAGLAVRQSSAAGVLTLTKGSNMWAGISLGKSLSDHSKTAVLRSGLKVPVLLEGGPARQVVTITSYANLIEGSDFDTLQLAIADESVDVTLTFKGSESTEDDVAAATGNNETAAALAAAINAHSVLSLHFEASVSGAVVTITALDPAIEGADIDIVYTDEDQGAPTVGLTIADDAATFVDGGGAPDFVVIGQKVYFSDDTGKADDPNSNSTVSDAIYVSGVLTGINEAGEEVACALVDMPGGL